MTLAEQELALLEELEQLKAKVAAVRGKGVASYIHDPVGFVKNCVKFKPGQGLADYQAEILQTLQRDKRVAVRGPRGLGKSGVASFAILWFAVTRDAAGRDWKIATTAGSWSQLTEYLWPEISKWSMLLDWEKIGRPPFSARNELMKNQMRLRHGLALAASPDKPEKIEGLHADSVLVVLDEAKIIPPDIFDSIEGSFSGAGQDSDLEALALAISTPGEPAGRFYDIHTRKEGLEDWRVRHVTLDEAVAAKRMTYDWAAKRKKLWGENSALYQNHVLGEFCADDEDAVIPLRWVEAAFERWREWERAGKPDQDGLKSVGVDVARSGLDKTVAAVRHGDVITRIEAWAKADTMETTGRVKGIMEAESGATAVVDVIGIGAGVYDRLREQGIKSDPFNAGRKTTRKDKTGQFGYYNCLTGDARVLPVGQLLRIYRSRCEGPLFRVKTASGDEFTATANHNVLTPDGWVAVQFLNAGDKLCDASGRERMTPAGPDVGDVPPKISEIYHAAENRWGSERVQGSVVNFHGDLPVSDVDVVELRSDLLPVRPSFGQCGDDGQFSGALHAPPGLAGDGGATYPVWLLGPEGRDAHGLLPALVPAGGAGPVAGLGDTARDQPVGLGVAAPGNSVLLKDAQDAVIGSAVFLDQCLDRSSGGIPGGDLGSVEFGDKQCLRLGFAAPLDAVLVQDAADDVLVDRERLGERGHRLAIGVARDDLGAVDILHHGEPGSIGAAAWLDAVFGEDLIRGGPCSPEAVAERCHRLACEIPLDEIISIERTAHALGHEAPFVYTLETSTGAYQTSSIVQRNCRSEGWWSLREILEPPYSRVALPPDDELVGDLTALHYDHTSDGKIRVEGKDDIRKRIGRSTDRGDAVMQAFRLSSGSWADAYGTMNCPSEKCGRPFMKEANGKPRTECPFCKAPLDEPGSEAA